MARPVGMVPVPRDRTAGLTLGQTVRGAAARREADFGGGGVFPPPVEPVVPPPGESLAGAGASGLDPVVGEEPPFPGPLFADEEEEDPLPFVSSRFCASTYPESR